MLAAAVAERYCNVMPVTGLPAAASRDPWAAVQLIGMVHHVRLHCGGAETASVVLAPCSFPQRRGSRRYPCSQNLKLPALADRSARDLDTIIVTTFHAQLAARLAIDAFSISLMVALAYALSYARLRAARPCCDVRR
jgi:hypothetical protein